MSQVRTKDGSIQSSEEKPVQECMANFFESLFKSEQPSTQDQSEWQKRVWPHQHGPKNCGTVEGGFSTEAQDAAVADEHAGWKIPRNRRASQRILCCLLAAGWGGSKPSFAGKH